MCGRVLVLAVWGRSLVTTGMMDMGGVGLVMTGSITMICLGWVIDGQSLSTQWAMVECSSQAVWMHLTTRSRRTCRWGRNSVMRTMICVPMRIGVCFFMDEGDQLHTKGVTGEIGSAGMKGFIGQYPPYTLRFPSADCGNYVLMEYAALWPMMGQATMTVGSLPRWEDAAAERKETLALTSASNAECCA